MIQSTQQKQEVSLACVSAIRLNKDLKVKKKEKMHRVSTKWNVVGQQVKGIENMVAFRGQVPTIPVLSSEYYGWKSKT